MSQQAAPSKALKLWDRSSIVESLEVMMQNFAARFYLQPLSSYPVGANTFSISLRPKPYELDRVTFADQGLPLIRP